MSVVALDSLSQQPGTVHCHGTFDLLHPGHVAHLEAARALGDRLVVTVTADAFVRKGPNRPAFPAHHRAQMLAALSCVDEVAIVEDRTGLPAIDAVRPRFYVKGKDWEAKQDHPDMIAETASVESYGGRVVFLGDTLYSSTALINRERRQAPELSQFLKQLRVTPEEFRTAVTALGDAKVLVLGDPIRDIYHTVNVQGLTAKASVLSLRHEATEVQDGGAWAIERHLQSFTPNVRTIRLVGEPVTKERFVSHPTGDQPLTKYFAVMRTPLPSPSWASPDALTEQLQWADLCVVADFGHGAITADIRTQVQDQAKWLAVMCQTNSANYGFNILSQQYRACDLFALDRTELDLCIGHRGHDPALSLCELQRKLGAQYAFLTRGDVDTIGRCGTESVMCPAIEQQPVDTLGAGDAFFALVSLAAVKGYSLALTTLLGQLAGAQAVRTVGNRVPVSKSLLLEHGMALLAK